jgi:hypothetical protein
MVAILPLSLFLNCTVSQKSAAQDKENQQKITAFNGAELTIKDENSYKLKLIAQADLLNLECSTGDAFRVGAGITFDYYLPKFASLHAEYVNAYINLQKFDANTLAKGDNTISGFSLFEAGGRLHIMDRKATARHKLILSQHIDYTFSGTVTTTRYIKARFPCRRVLAVRGGFYRTVAPVSTDMNKSDVPGAVKGTVKTKDGSMFSNVYFTNDHTTGFYVGLSDLFNMSVRTSYKGNTYNSSLLREVFADVIIAETTFDPILSAGKSYEIVPNAPGSFQTSRIGWRVGKKMIFTRRTVNMGFSFELGNRPGVAGRGSYFGCGWTIAFVR